jgi:hypothetical protein
MGAAELLAAQCSLFDHRPSWRYIPQFHAPDLRRMQVVLSLLLLGLQAYAEVTIYTQVPLGTGTGTTATASATYTGAAAYDPTSLTPPPIPTPAPATQFPVQLFSGGMVNLSIPQSGSFVGFSVELSVADQICESCVRLMHCGSMLTGGQSRKEWVSLACQTQ